MLLELSAEQLLIIFTVTLFAKSFGSIFNGAGFLTQPMMLAVGVPPHMVVANDVAASTGVSLSSSYVFFKHDYTIWEIAKWWIPGVMIGPVIGAKLLVLTPPDTIEKIISFVCLIGGAYLLLFSKPRPAQEERPLPKNWKLWSVLFSLLLGVYFGFSGAGGGIISSMALYSFFGLSLKHMLGTRRFIHLPGTIVSAITYYFLGLLHWPLFFTLFTACFIAGWAGSTIAVKVPERILRPLFFVMIVILASYTLVR